MAKRGAKSTKKKRNKRYTGEDAAVRGTNVTRVVATKKNPAQELWANKKTALIGYSVLLLILSIVGIGIFFLITWLF